MKRTAWRALGLLVAALILSAAARTEEPRIPGHKLYFISPHPDDIPLTFGGLLLNHHGFPDRENFYEIFCNISNYTANYLDLQTAARVEQVTLLRTQEDLSALTEVFKGWNRYRYQAHGEYDAPLRDYPGPIEVMGQDLGPTGNFSTFREQEKAFFWRVYAWARGVLLQQDECSAFVLMANVHDIDHFVVREAMIRAAFELGDDAKCQIYFGEDQPYTGAPGRVHRLVEKQIWQFTHRLDLEAITYPIDVEAKVKLFNDHYLTQYEPMYGPAIVRRVEEIGGERIYRWDKSKYKDAPTDPSCKEAWCQLK